MRQKLEEGKSIDCVKKNIVAHTVVANEIENNAAE